MTISARRRTYWLLFALSCLHFVAAFLLWMSQRSMSTIPDFLLRSGSYGFFRSGSASIPSWVIAAAGACLPALVASLTMGFILASFRKTVSAEIFYFSFWIASLAFETLRLGIFTMALRDIPDALQIVLAKLLSGARYAGTLSLFVAGIFAAGLRNERYGATLLLILGVATGMAFLMPLNTGSYLSTLELRAGYLSLNEWFFWSISAMSVLNFFVAISVRGEKSFAFVAAGCAMSIVGARLLSGTWNPYLLVLGFLLSCAGSWLFVSRLHEYYLWQ